MSFLKVSRNYNIDGKKLFELWLELDSFYKVSDHLRDQGIINEKTGNPYNIVTLSRTTWRYILKNSDEALEVAKSHGREISDEYWEQVLVRKAYSYYVTVTHSRPKFYDWLKTKGLYDKYKDYRKIDPKPVI